MDKEIKKNPVKTSRKNSKDKSLSSPTIVVSDDESSSGNFKKKTVKPKVPTRKQVNKDSKVNAEESTNESGITKKEVPRKKTVKRVSIHESQKSRNGDCVKPTTKYIYSLKGNKQIVGLTAYDAIMAKLVSKAGVDFILVGDSVGTTLLGYETTIPVTIDDMIHHTAAVKRGMPDCLVVADLPFGEASFSFDRLLDSCRRLMQNGADAVKIEGGKDIADDVEKLVATGIPVMGHIGLLPQTVKAIGGYRKFGSEQEEADSIYTDAMCLEEAGCFAIIAEMLDNKLADELTKQMLPPLIGIGSGDNCDGQILVTHDLLGLTPSPLPSFVKPCASLGLDGLNALQKYVHRIRGSKLKE